MNIKKIIFSVFILLFLTACGKEEEVYEKRDVKVDSVFDKIEEKSSEETEKAQDENKENEKKEESEETQEENKNAQVTSTVNLRQSPNTEEDNVLGSIPGGSEIEIIENQGEWSKISYQGRQGFVRSDLIQG